MEEVEAAQHVVQWPHLRNTTPPGMVVTTLAGGTPDTGHACGRFDDARFSASGNAVSAASLLASPALRRFRNARNKKSEVLSHG